MMNSRVKKILFAALIVFLIGTWSWIQDRTPEPLSAEDAALYKAVFAAQDKGDMKAADALIPQITDSRLMGYVLSERYLHPLAYHASFKELHRWLAEYKAYPEADRIVKLAQKRKPEGSLDSFESPEFVAFSAGQPFKPRVYESHRVRSPQVQAKLKTLQRGVMAKIRDGKMVAAFKQINTPESLKLLDVTEYDALRAEIAAGFLYDGDRGRAYALAAQSVKRSGLRVPKAGWVAGLVAWQVGRYKEAAGYFEVSAKSPYASGWMLTSGAYWAARSHMRLGNVKAVSAWLNRGVTNPYAFYGLISMRALGQDFNFDSTVPNFTRKYHEILLRMPEANRAMALVECGKKELAEAQFLRIQPETRDEREALLAYAGYAGLSRLQDRMVGPVTELMGQGGKVRWKPDSGYSIDPALIHAITGQESGFDPEAKSPKGARGLMQLMPATARSVAGRKHVALENPQTNLKIGQMYLVQLLRDQSVNGDLLSLMVAYNAGPGNLAKWKKRWPDVTDPLLFIELIPSAETRGYVQRVLADYWMLRLRGNQNVSTLDAVVSGKSAQYAGTAL